MSYVFAAAVVFTLCVMALAGFAERVYQELDRFLSRDSSEAVKAWERDVEPRLRLSRDSATISASVLSHMALGALALLLASRVAWHGAHPALSAGEAALELAIAEILFGRLLPQFMVARLHGRPVRRLARSFQVLFYLSLPVTLLIALVLSIAKLAEPEAPQDARAQTEAVDALLEADEEEGILEESDRELVRSVVEFGDKVVREVMTPRPNIFAVPATMSLEEFTAQVNEHNLSRIPVYAGNLDNVIGIAFARDLLSVHDVEAAELTVNSLVRAAHYVPETKKVNELLREMQHGKQHMSIAIDEYGGVAGLVTIEDLLEAIVGNIEDEHDLEQAGNLPVPEEGGTYVIPGSFEVSRLRELFAQPTQDGAQDESAIHEQDGPAQALPQLLTGYDATTVGGLVSEIAGHIPLPGEVVEDGPLRLEILASTDRLVERVRVGLQRVFMASEPE